MHLTSTETAVFIGTVPALLGTVVGAGLTGLQQWRGEAKAGRDRLRRDTAELLTACGDLLLSLEALRVRQQTGRVKCLRVLKMACDFVARIEPGVRNNWPAAVAGAGSDLISLDRAELQEAATASVPAMSRINLAVAGIRSAGDEQFQEQVASLMDAATNLAPAYPKRGTRDKAVARLHAEVAAMTKEVDRLTRLRRRSQGRRRHWRNRP